MSAHIFISYSQPDEACAHDMLTRIEAHALKAWIAPRDISPSAEWAAEIIDAIGSAWIMVLVFSPHSNASPQVRREVERAVHKGVPVLPFRLENIEPSKSLEYFLSAQHWLDAFPPPLEPHYGRLCTHLLARQPGSTARSMPTSEVGAMRARPIGPAELAHDAPRSAQQLALDTAELTRLERELAFHVGPVARILVRRALERAEDRETLYQRLAREITHEPDRNRFLRDCRAGLGVR